MNPFNALGLSPALSDALASLGIDKPSPIQERALPVTLSGRDTMIESETGSGKTLVYLLPLLQKLDYDSKDLQGLILAPTHELASQISRELERVSRAANLETRAQLLIGGIPLKRMLERLKSKPLIAIGTAGRIIELVEAKKLKLSSLIILVLDEADRLLAKDLRDESLKAISLCPESRQVLLASATIPGKVVGIATKFTKDAREIRVSSGSVLRDDIEHWLIACERRERIELMRRLNAALKMRRALVFVELGAQVPVVSAKLDFAGLKNVTLHARLSKEERRNAIDSFRKGAMPFLITTDLGARGLDIPDIDYVIHLDPPRDAESYVHRAGRTARMGRKGISILFADEVELNTIKKIEAKLALVIHAKRVSSGAIIDIAATDVKPTMDRT